MRKKGLATGDYQSFLENKWIDQRKKNRCSSKYRYFRSGEGRFNQQYIELHLKLSL